MKKLLLTFAFITLATPAFAAHNITVNVNGLVCDFCAVAIEKVFGKQEAVESVLVDLNAKYIKIQLKDGMSMADETIKELIVDSGYNVDSIEHDSHE